MLVEETFDTSDSKEVLKITKHLAAQKVPVEEHKSLRKEEKYTEDQAVQDFNEIKREMASFTLR